MQPLKPLIILAAGRSLRMGCAKGLLPYKGLLWLEWQLMNYFEAGGSKAVLILGEDQDLYFEKCPWLKRGRFKGNEIVCIFNDNVDAGSFYSLKLGIRNLSEKSGCFVTPIDVPFSDTSLWAFLEAGLTEARVAIPDYCGQGGHPIALDAGFCSQLLKEADDFRLDFAIRSAVSVRVATVEKSCCLNLNTPAEWKKFNTEGNELNGISAF